MVEQAVKLAEHVAKEKHDVFDHNWKGHGLLTTLFSTDYMDTLALISNAARRICSVQSSLAEATAPCKVFGDLHGQFRDLLLLLWAFGSPAERNAPSFIFNGDFVDRGRHQLETIGLLLALKVLLPEKVWLVRGNHEDRHMNKRYGFHEECLDRLGSEFGPKMFDMFHSVFDQLPLSCVISDRVLVVHGGLGDGAWSLDEVRSIRRPLRGNDLLEPWIANMLWSDPIEDDAHSSDIFGVHESPRGGQSTRFGWNVTQTFCARNGLGLVVRSHQSKRGGMGVEIMHDNHLISVFSARDYEQHGNDGTILSFSMRQDMSSMLTVRPQVLRSTTKSNKEAHKHMHQDGHKVALMTTFSL